MNLAPWTTILFATVAIAASGSDIAGNWRAVVVGGVRHMMIAQATFEFKVEGSRLTGTAHVGNDAYPGTAPISDGKIDGDRISFTVIGEHPSSNGVPTMKFEGTIHGVELDLSMSLSDGAVDGGRMEMKGEKISRQLKLPHP
jgi:hypothetical protein